LLSARSCTKMILYTSFLLILIELLWKRCFITPSSQMGKLSARDVSNLLNHWVMLSLAFCNLLWTNTNINNPFLFAPQILLTWFFWSLPFTLLLRTIYPWVKLRLAKTIHDAYLVLIIAKHLSKHLNLLTYAHTSISINSLYSHLINKQTEHKMVKQLAQGHTACKWYSVFSNSRPSDSIFLASYDYVLWSLILQVSAKKYNLCGTRMWASRGALFSSLIYHYHQSIIDA
jgi:hypothetical protein